MRHLPAIQSIGASGLVLTATGTGLWLLLAAAPLLCIAVMAATAPPTDEAVSVGASLGRSLLFSAGIAAVAVALGYGPGRLLGTLKGSPMLLLGLLLLPLVLPRYVLYYAWSLLLSPTTALGRTLISHPGWAEAVGLATSWGVLVTWYWPLAALLLAHGWRNIEDDVWAGAQLEARRSTLAWRFAPGLLWRPVLLAFLVCAVLALSEFAVYHLAAIRTVGTELAVLYELTGSTAAVARAATPLLLIAVIAAAILATQRFDAGRFTQTTRYLRQKGTRTEYALLTILLLLSVAAPIALLLINVKDVTPFLQFWRLHADELAWSALTAAIAAAAALLMAAAVLLIERTGAKTLAAVMSAALFAAMFLPASLVAVGLLKVYAWGPARTWLIVAAGQALRCGGMALIVLRLCAATRSRTLGESAALDGAAPAQVWRHIHLPLHAWPIAGAGILAVLLSMTELSATMVLLPAGLPNFAQRLLNQMHYARDQHVIASCLALIAAFGAAAAITALLFAVTRRRWAVLATCLAVATLVCGCENDTAAHTADIAGAFGDTGRGPGEFLYPRAIDRAADGTLVVVDKTGRVQILTPDGVCTATVQMPKIEKGKPTGLSVGPDGKLYVADTHYHRIMIFDVDGTHAASFGEYGEGDGQFIYPTDVAFAADGRIFVSEYGGHDRISIYSPQYEFLGSFGVFGSGEGELSRPSALCIDEKRQRLYVADACNHRIAIYDLAGQLQGYIGELGREVGQLRYPYDLALLNDGRLVVCEYGNNRIQVFSTDGESLAVRGEAGRALGQLAYPWGVATDEKDRIYIVDAGNNRVQIWRL